MSRIERNNERITLPCIALCGLIFVILGFFHVVPENIVTIVKPLFIEICIVFHRTGFSRFSNFKWMALLIVYYVMLLLFSKINSLTVNTFISLKLFAVFFMFAACKIWSPKEIRLIFISVCVACTIQAVIILVSNGGLLHASGAQQVKYLEI